MDAHCQALLAAAALLPHSALPSSDTQSQQPGWTSACGKAVSVPVQGPDHLFERHRDRATQAHPAAAVNHTETAPSAVPAASSPVQAGHAIFSAARLPSTAHITAFFNTVPPAMGSGAHAHAHGGSTACAPLAASAPAAPQSVLGSARGHGMLPQGGGAAAGRGGTSQRYALGAGRGRGRGAGGGRGRGHGQARENVSGGADAHAAAAAGIEGACPSSACAGSASSLPSWVPVCHTIPGTRFLVDFFSPQSRTIKGVPYWILTHFHADHYKVR